MQTTGYSGKSSTSQTNFNQTDQKVAFFEKEGFVGPFTLGQTASLVALRDAMSQAIGEAQNQEQKTSSSLIQTNVMDRRIAHLTSKLVYDLSTEPLVLDDVADFLGPNILFWMAETISREPGHDGHIVEKTGQIWHIDVINGWIKGVHVSIAVTDMTLKTGCLLVIPGTHKYDADLVALAQAGECDLTDAESMIKLADRMHPENAPHRIEPIEMKAGQYCFTRGGIWHGVSRNNDSRTRFGLVARFAKPDVEIRGFSGNQIPCIVVRGEDSYQLNLPKNPPENS
ncbi:phytanoyl-CoA dioxygenase family protein [Planktothrix agardhii 1806]|jgi:non-heme Fe2+,alpha-ketoglutarate-dependent halogenase|uniref:phytanoyl-CoA dioxygenase family protein n=1 Tax=Planktothrix agardhii TaxID=1160 RepID=UPI000DBB3209|nr:phytanoyl-CoA dioxygenase family protein [Planktothrix agardhii]BBD57019.1 phytanoyl-CoA dioxygenase [Planktothrix agardhii NIES-204]MCF3569026.1 phytanoyl-CoA dioxygenase family protein [Planktothrix agardhii 1807]MCF3573670.1 phytanoyl-CoA dioxygenase family protein [Planktothrix agardhii 1805]MCF3573699.1 phytanoyl-CoA dioxygenase family protein [Planktothrix agardhii 1805]MCF3587814.1 phytanoyl-CoA dioxygenase family protein [Planktothrix agardhii 1803]